MRSGSRRFVWLSVTAVCYLALTFVVSCGSGPRQVSVSSPDSGSQSSVALPPTRQIEGSISTDNFKIDSGERVQVAGDVTVRCQTATVTGELFSHVAIMMH